MCVNILIGGKIKMVVSLVSFKLCFWKLDIEKFGGDVVIERLFNDNDIVVVVVYNLNSLLFIFF